MNSLGLQAIYSACLRLYPDQPNPLQVTALRKFWMGGPDPLDYISMYRHPGTSDSMVPAHWHYVTYGLSDLYGDGRLHEHSISDGPSGFGFELTFRLKRETGEDNPPTWPAALLQSLARYVFTAQTVLCAGDHVPWRKPLEEGADPSASRIRHMLIVEDSQMGQIASPHGAIKFLQVVGLCEEELRLAQRWNGPGVASLLSQRPVTGGHLLVTDMRRGESLFELDPALQEEAMEGARSQGSNLSGVTTRFTWEELAEEDKEIDVVGPGKEEEKSAPREDLGACGGGGVTPLLSPGCLELMPPRQLDGVHLKMGMEAGEVLPVVVADRLRHGRHFTFMQSGSDQAVTLVPRRVTGAFVSEDNPFVARGPWLQIFLSDDFLEQLEYQFGCLSYPEDVKLPLIFRWPERRLKISILEDLSPELAVPPPIGPPAM